MPGIAKKWQFGLLVVPFVLALLALNGFGFIFKAGTAASGIIILLLIYSRELSNFKDVWYIVGAFLFSIVGDWFLSNMKGNSEWFVFGILFYFLAHLGYLLFALTNGKINKLVTGIILLVFLIFYFVTLFPAINESVLKVAVLIYLLVSCFSLGAAWGIKHKNAIKWSFIFGVFLILFSDTIISFKEFVGFQDLNFFILPTYYLAHIAIIFSIIARNQQ